MLDLNKFKINTASREPVESNRIEKISKKDIAVIGMACEFPDSKNSEEFWVNISGGRDLVRPFPDSRRKDTDLFLKLKGFSDEQLQYSEGAYLDEIDKFDPLFFKISPKEAGVMDPNQRFFLQTAWKALEDAGYGGEKLKGSKTGVFLGYSSDFGVEYKDLVQEMDPESQNLSLGGNIKSIIASRISYILDFKGPSLAVDTACSSSLTAIHLACRALRGGECDQALAGSVKVHFLSLKGGEGIGIRSSINRARTFDDASDGTGSGEGCAVILLKPLHRALEDGDRILALIKGSAMNQDGSSIGITAPNALAQADVIELAWKDAGIDPETISYIEAHGTGTKLGDPIEIDGITRAFQRYTAKKQFCGIGAVKTNIGHLDNAAGMAGIIKLILSLQHRAIPPIVHFQRPNRVINFPESPVYMVERLTSWESTGPRRAGISAFGLSGTNCHLVLEEAPEVSEQLLDAAVPEAVGETKNAAHLLTLSATKETVLRDLIKAYVNFLTSSASDGLDLERMCYTANTGRGHYTHRLTLQFITVDELQKKLSALYNANDLKNLVLDGVYYGENKLNDEDRERLTALANEHLAEKASDLRNQALAKLYVAGAGIDWEAFYQGKKLRKVQLPTYPFERKRCWVDMKAGTGQSLNVVESKIHPLLDRIHEEAEEELVYLTEFSAERQWELKDHLVSGYYVLPGTAYLEIARAASMGLYPEGVELKDVVFLTPLATTEGETREAHTILRKSEDYHEFNVVSKDAQNGGWVTHVDAKVYPLTASEIHQYNLDELKARCPETVKVSYSDGEVKSAIVTGPHWKNLNTYHLGTDELLVYLTLQEQFLDDLDNYTIYPPLLDSAVNAVSQHVGEGLYLPFSYSSFKLLDRMPANFYSYIRKREKQAAGLETVAFDIILMDESGRAFIEVEDYKIKKVRTQELKVARNEFYHGLNWIERERRAEERSLAGESVLFFSTENELAEGLKKRLQSASKEVIEVTFGTEYRKIAEDHYIISGTEKDYHTLFDTMRERGIRLMVHAGVLGDGKESENTEPVTTTASIATSAAGIPGFAQLNEQLQRGVMSLFRLTRAMVAAKWKEELGLILIADTAYPVTGEEAAINPTHAAYFGLAKVLGAEFMNLKVRAIDMDGVTSLDEVIAEIGSTASTLQVAYRGGKRYIEEFRKVETAALLDVPVELKKEGIYIVTGGTGALGLAVSRYLASQQQVKLALINRTSLPARSEWDNIIAGGEAGKLSAKLQAIRELETRGAEVICYAANVSDYTEMSRIVEDLRANYGRINGIIHTAGVAGDGFILRKEEATFATVLAPKIQGTWILDHLTRRDRPDFFILFSSINALYGLPGQGDYTAANSYLDSFAAYRQSQGFRTQSINWAAWKEIGMAADYGVNDDRGIFKALSTDKGLRAFEEILQKEIIRITVGELNFDTLGALEGNYPFEMSSEIRTQISRQKKLHQTPEEQGAGKKRAANVVLKGGSANELETVVAGIWAEVLGLDEVDVYESFYDLGGDSILATYILKAMEQEFPGLIDISDIFTYSNVHDMAEYLQSKMSDKPKEKLKAPEEEVDLDADLDAMLDQLLNGELQAGEAEKLLISKLGGNL